MELQECRVVLVSVAEQIGEYPIAEAISIAPSTEKATERARQELSSYVPDLSNQLVYVRDLGPIFYPPIPVTIFLYTQKAGRIK